MGSVNIELLKKLTEEAMRRDPTGMGLTPEEAAELKKVSEENAARNRAGAVNVLNNIPSGPVSGALAAVSPDTYAAMTRHEVGGEGGTAASALENLGMAGMGGIPVTPGLVSALRMASQPKVEPPKPASSNSMVAEPPGWMKSAAGRVRPSKEIVDTDFIAPEAPPAKIVDKDWVGWGKVMKEPRKPPAPTEKEQREDFSGFKGGRSERELMSMRTAPSFPTPSDVEPPRPSKPFNPHDIRPDITDRAGNVVKPVESDVEPTPRRTLRIEFNSETPGGDALREAVGTMLKRIQRPPQPPKTATPADGVIDTESGVSPEAFSTNRFLDNILKQTQGALRTEEPGMGTFLDAGQRSDFMNARVEPSARPQEGAMADFVNTKFVSDTVRERGGDAPLAKYLPQIGRTRVNPQSIASRSKDPTDFVYNLVGTLAHEVGGHSIEANHPVPQEWVARVAESGTPSRPGKARPNISEVPPVTATAHPGESSLRTSMDVTKGKMLETPLAQALIETSRDPNSPIAKLFQRLRGETGKTGGQKTATVPASRLPSDILASFQTARSKNGWGPNDPFTASDFKMYAGLSSNDDASAMLKQGIKNGTIEVVGTQSRNAGTTGRQGQALSMKRTSQVYRVKHTANDK